MKLAFFYFGLSVLFAAVATYFFFSQADVRQKRDVVHQQHNQIMATLQEQSSRFSKPDYNTEMKASQVFSEYCDLDNRARNLGVGGGVCTLLAIGAFVSGVAVARRNVGERKAHSANVA